MCTALSFKTKDHYFGRNLDLGFSYGETVTVTPRNFPLSFRKAGALNRHYAMIGMAIVKEGYPLYFDATNEAGLSMAGLNFPGNAVYRPAEEGKTNISPFEFIPWVLGQCPDLARARELLKQICLADIPFSNTLPLSPLHWIISDSRGSLTVEAVREGLMVYDNPTGILTNNPPFPLQLFNLNNYMGLSPAIPQNTFAPSLSLGAYSLGMGALGLPGDLSSMSRFAKAAFTALNSVSDDSENAAVSQFFHILGAVCQQRGCALDEEGRFEITQYTSCCNTRRGIYYYTTYDNSRISAVDLHKENLDSDHLVSWSLITEQQIFLQNGAERVCPCTK